MIRGCISQKTLTALAVVSNRGSCTNTVAKSIVQILAPYSCQGDSNIRNTEAAVEEVSTWKVESDEVLVRLDVE